MYSEYMALNMVAIPKMGISNRFHLIRLDNMMISPIRFGNGGNPKLAAQNNSHHVGSMVVMDLNPRIINIFRVWVRSYRIFASANSAEDTSPWAIISIRAPLKDQFVNISIPEVTRHMCPTEE